MGDVADGNTSSNTFSDITASSGGSDFDMPDPLGYSEGELEGLWKDMSELQVGADSPPSGGSLCEYSELETAEDADTPLTAENIIRNERERLEQLARLNYAKKLVDKEARTRRFAATVTSQEDDNSLAAWVKRHTKNPYCELCARYGAKEGQVKIEVVDILNDVLPPFEKAIDPLHVCLEELSLECTEDGPGETLYQTHYMDFEKALLHQLNIYLFARTFRVSELQEIGRVSIDLLLLYLGELGSKRAPYFDKRGFIRFARAVYASPASGYTLRSTVTTCATTWVRPLFLCPEFTQLLMDGGDFVVELAFNLAK